MARKSQALTLHYQMLANKLSQIREGAVQVAPGIVLVDVAPEETGQDCARLRAPGDSQVVE